MVFSFRAWFLSENTDSIHRGSREHFLLASGFFFFASEQILFELGVGSYTTMG